VVTAIEQERTMGETTAFRDRLARLVTRHQALLDRPNAPREDWYCGTYERYLHPVLEAEHVPLHWRFDLDERTNPHLQERLGIGVVFNPGALLHDGKILLAARVEGADRKSFLAIAESTTGIDRFRFWPGPMVIPELPGEADVNVYDIRLTRHEDGWVYGVFCTEIEDPTRPGEGWARAGVVRSRDLSHWERLPNLVVPSRQQRNAVLHPEFVEGKYAFYTRPQETFLAQGEGTTGLAFGLVDDLTAPRIGKETVIDSPYFHSIKDAKNGQGPPPIKTPEGWLHIAHAVRGCAAGMRYTLYAFMTRLDAPAVPIHQPGGHLIAPLFDERVGDVSNVVFVNGWVERDGVVYIYYASSDTRVHVATTSVERLVDYCKSTPPDGRTSGACARQRAELARRNIALVEQSGDPLLRRALG
jgi:4-O-beta-D-mannosyl-D-glucose phosphorylase